jgi:uronate dehydrogenase
MRVLIAGAAGHIGRTLAEGLTKRGHEVRGLDLLPPPADHCALGAVVGDCTEPAVVAQAVNGVDAVVHLAGRPSEGPLAEELASHVTTTATLLDAMVAAGVKRIAYASSNHAVGLHERTDLLSVDVRPRPDTFYGIAKVAAEGLLSMYVDRAGIEAVAMRIGSFLDRPETDRALATWLSPGDCVRMVEAALTAPDVGFAVIYGISGNTRAWWDLEPGRAIGYEPVDDAEQYAADIPVRDEDAAENARVGGPFATLPEPPSSLGR